MTSPYRLAGLELAAGWVPGYVGLSAVPWPRRPASSVRTALEEILRRALSARPCVVAFSGGRDSSVVLAVAVDLARREGLPLPIPVTREHPGIAAVNEESWQRRVIDHLGLQEWVRLPFGDELDVVGPVAQHVLRRHGVVWPAAAHTSLPLFEAAKGGVVLTGEGGDELFLPSRLRLVGSVVRGATTDWRLGERLRWTLQLTAPRAIRRRRARVTTAAGVPEWLMPGARSELIELLAADEAAAPFGLKATLRCLFARRAWRAGARTLACLADDTGTGVVHPLLAPRVLAALHAASRPWGYANRTAALQDLFGDVLPRDVLERRSKVIFNDALFTHHARHLASAWSGEGTAADVVDAVRLRREWMSERPSVLSAPLLQQVWCDLNAH